MANSHGPPKIIFFILVSKVGAENLSVQGRYFRLWPHA